MASFKVPCPSCEAPVLIKNPNLVGTKVECPKCKYRFKVEEPAAEAAAADKKDKKTDKKEKVKTAGGKNKKLVPIAIGAVAVVVLIGGVIAFSGGGKKTTDPFAGLNKGGKGGSGGTEEQNPEEKKDQPKLIPGGSDKVTSNLLPGQAVSVYRFNMDPVRGSPIHGALVDQQVTAMFQGTFGFTPDDVETYIHCFAGDGREPFGVIKTKGVVKPPEVLAKMPVQPKPVTVKGRDLYAFRTAPFLHAVANALAMRSFLGDVYATIPMTPATPPKDKPYGVCVYDSQHVLVGDYALMQRFLGELADNGYPPFKSELNTAAEPPPPAPTEPAPTAPPKPGTPPKKAAPPAPAPPAPGEKAYTSIDAYRTIEFQLKRALDLMEADRTVVPLMVYAEKFDARQYDPKMMKKDYQLLGAALDPIANRLRYLSANVTTFGQRELIANLRLSFGDANDAREIAKDKLAPGLALVVEMLKGYLAPSALEFRDHTSGNPVTTPGTGQPGTGFPPGMGPNPGYGPNMGPGPGGMPPPRGGGSSGGPPTSAGGMGVLPPPGGGEGEGPGTPPPTGTQPPKEQPPGHVDLWLIDNELLIGIDINWTDTVFRTTIAPRVVGVTNQIKGKMAVYSAESGQHLIAAAGPKALKVNGAVPRGAWDRARTDPARLGLEYPPIQRVSLFAELLPHLGRGQLAGSVNRNLAWYDEKNLAAGGAWVPELLVPTYPQSAWRATSQYAPDHTFGATNYVAISGTGLDSARYNPNDPARKKQLGMTGYGWGSKAEEVTDGLSNTIYLMQTPPGLQQPWIAGGGATVRGLDENDPMAGFKYTHGGKSGTYALMGDGSVRFIPTTIDKKVLLALGTRAGGDNDALADVNRDAPLVDPPKSGSPTPVVKADPKPEEKKPDEKKGSEPVPKKEPAAKLEEAPAPRSK